MWAWWADPRREEGSLPAAAEGAGARRSRAARSGRQVHHRACGRYRAILLLLPLARRRCMRGIAPDTGAMGAGITRWRRRLDWIISQLRPTGGALDPELHQILRMGIYELLQLGKPDHVISDHVDLARQYVRPEAARVANGAPDQPPAPPLQAPLVWASLQHLDCSDPAEKAAHDDHALPPHTWQSRSVAGVLRNVTRMRQSNTVPNPATGCPGSSQADVIGIAASHPHLDGGALAGALWAGGHPAAAVLKQQVRCPCSPWKYLRGLWPKLKT